MLYIVQGLLILFALYRARYISFPRRGLLILFILIFTFLLSYLLFTLYSNTSLSIYFIQIKWFVYLSIVLVFFRNVNIPPLELLGALISLLFVYCYDKFILSNDRPEWLIENNFEVILITMIFVKITGLQLKTSNSLCFIIYILIVLLSGSKSGLIIMGVLLFLTLIRLNFNLGALIFVLSNAIVIYIFNSGTYLEMFSFDRFLFAIDFYDELNHQSFLDLLLPNIKPESLNLQSNLFLEYEDLMIGNEFYSTAFHGMNLRLIYDFGVLGFFLIMYFENRILRAMTNNYLSSIAILVILLNGFSVSGINSDYWFLSLFVISDGENKVLG